MKIFSALVAFSAAFAPALPAAGQAPAVHRDTQHVEEIPRLPSPMDGLGEDALRAVSGWQWVYLAGAVVATASMSPTGADHAIRVGVQEHARVPAWGDAAYYAGYVLPVLVPASLYVAGLIARDRDAAGAGSAAIQALAFTELVTVVFDRKAFAPPTKTLLAPASVELHDGRLKL